jgi:hypothetical protein
MQPEKVSCIIAGCVLDLAGHLAELFISVPREVRLLIAWCAAPGHSLRVGRFPEIVGYLPGGALATQTATPERSGREQPRSAAAAFAGWHWCKPGE